MVFRRYLQNANASMYVTEPKPWRTEP